MVLGIVVDQLSGGRGYERFVQDLLSNIDIYRMKLAAASPRDVDISEVTP